MADDCVGYSIEFLLNEFKMKDCLEPALEDHCKHAEDQAEICCSILDKFPKKVKNKVAVAFLYPCNRSQYDAHSLVIFKKKKELCIFDSMRRWTRRGIAPIKYSVNFWYETGFSRCEYPSKWADMRIGVWMTCKGYSLDIKPKIACNQLKKNLKGFVPDVKFDPTWRDKWEKKLRDQYRDRVLRNICNELSRVKDAQKEAEQHRKLLIKFGYDEFEGVELDKKFLRKYNKR